MLPVEAHRPMACSVSPCVISAAWLSSSRFERLQRAQFVAKQRPSACSNAVVFTCSCSWLKSSRWTPSPLSKDGLPPGPQDEINHVEAMLTMKCKNVNALPALGTNEPSCSTTAGCIRFSTLRRCLTTLFQLRQLTLDLFFFTMSGMSYKQEESRPLF